MAHQDKINICSFSDFGMCFPRTHWVTIANIVSRIFFGKSKTQGVFLICFALVSFLTRLSEICVGEACKRKKKKERGRGVQLKYFI